MKAVACHECGKITSDHYYTDFRGIKMKEPRCRECHEQAVRIPTRQRNSPQPETVAGLDYRDYMT